MLVSRHILMETIGTDTTEFIATAKAIDSFASWENCVRLRKIGS